MFSAHSLLFLIELWSLLIWIQICFPLFLWRGCYIRYRTLNLYYEKDSSRLWRLRACCIFVNGYASRWNKSEIHKTKYYVEHWLHKDFKGIMFVCCCSMYIAVRDRNGYVRLVNYQLIGSRTWFSSFVIQMYNHARPWSLVTWKKCWNAKREHKRASIIQPPLYFAFNFQSTFVILFSSLTLISNPVLFPIVVIVQIWSDLSACRILEFTLESASLKFPRVCKLSAG